jgi:hypothetical protein
MVDNIKGFAQVAEDRQGMILPIVSVGDKF